MTSIWNPHNELYHYGVRGQKKGQRRYQYEDGTWTELGKERRRKGRQQKDTIDNLINDLNTKFDYGVIIDGKRYDEDLSQVDWSKYRTMPIEEFEKEKIGVCWDFVNYQHYICNKNGIENKNYMIVCQRSDNPDDVLTHTFTIATIDGQQYWIESARWKDRGVHEVKSYKDVYDSIRKDEGGKDCDLYEYDPTGMDKGLTDQEYFDKATENLVYTSAIKHYEVGQGYGPRQTSYASKYYDPVKAHEYYEQHKQLKGRTRSASALDDEGKEMWSYVKQQIKSEKTAKIENSKAQMQAQVANIQQQIAALKTMSTGEKTAKKAEIQQKIQALKKQLAAKKQLLQSKLTDKTKKTAEEKSAKSKEIQNENRSLSEAVKADNRRAAENVRAQNSRMSESVRQQKQVSQSQINAARETIRKEKEQMSNAISKKREEIANTTDKTKKAKLRTELNKMLKDKKEFSDKATSDINKMSESKKLTNEQLSQQLSAYKSGNSQALAEYRSQNSAGLASARAQNSEDLNKFRETKAEELSQFRAKNRADVKSATDKTASEINSLREQLTSFNESKRQMTQEESKSLREQIKALRSANQANRKMLTEKYAEIQNEEYDKIYEEHQKKK